MQESISDLMIENDIKFTIKSRVKSVYSIYKKLSSGKKWSDIYDILALRLIVEKESDCYLAIGLIHSKFRPIQKRFKDYIAMPKENMYQSLHTGVFGIDGHIFEIQVRTHEMDEIAEKGIASHWSYKEKGTKKIQNMMEQKLEIFRSIIDTYKEADHEEELMSNINSNILGEYIYVFTPNGDVVELPLGSTPVDFAYRIHSKIGEQTVGAIVNDEIVPLSYELKDNDVVKINTSKNAKPNKEWLQFVKTNGAKGKIRSYFSKQERNQYIINGKNILDKELRKQKLSFNEVFSPEKLEKIKRDLKFNDLDDIYYALGSFRYTAGFVIRLSNEEKQDVNDFLTLRVSKTPKISKINSKNDIVVGEYNDILISLAKCCKPVLGDPILGFITKGEGITVHRADCINILNKSDRIINVSWSKTSENDYLTDIYVITLNDKNYVADLISKATIKNINVVSLHSSENNEQTKYSLTIKVKNVSELNDFLDSLYSLAFVKQVGRK
jgi:GTP pyrophosphokinase